VDTSPGPGPGSDGREPEGGNGPATDGETLGALDRAGDGQDGVDGDDPVAHDPLRFNQWMKRSTAGAVLSGIALGLQQALEPKRELPAFVMEAPGDPEDPDAPITLHFDPDDPTRTVAVIRAPAPPDDGSSGSGTPGPPPGDGAAASDR